MRGRGSVQSLHPDAGLGILGEDAAVAGPHNRLALSSSIARRGGHLDAARAAGAGIAWRGSEVDEARVLHFRAAHAGGVNV